MNNNNQDKLTTALSALANEKRRSMLDTLAFRPATVRQLAEESGLSLPAIHRHIRALEEAGLIRRKKVGRVNFVALNRTGLQKVQEWIMRYQTQWGSDRESLENYITNFTEETN